MSEPLDWPMRLAKVASLLDDETVDVVLDEDDGYCHIVDADGLTYYCGKPRVGEVACKTYEGEAICPTCGLPTCPTCAVRSDLAVRLEGT